jgi:predicted  nucleic acid-binding Zn-ribbon protein
MHAELTKLLELQHKDLVLFDTDQRLKAILDEVARLDGLIEAAQREVTAAETRVKDGTKKRQDLEVRIESYRAIQDRRRQRLEQVRGAREAQAVMTEVEMARAVLLKEENEWVRVAEGVHDLERGLKAAQDRLSQLQAEQAPVRTELASEQEKVTSEREAALATRNESAAALEKSLRTRYDRLRAARIGAVVVPLKGEACGACYTAVPRNRRTQIRAGILLDNCEACGAILFYEEIG